MSAVDIFLIVASVCAVILTIFAGVATFALVMALREARAILRRFAARGEHALERGERILSGIRLAQTWGKLFVKDLLNKKKTYE